MENDTRKNKKRFHQFSLFLLVYTLLVILWGAWVRISHSGDGCGASWPLCNGQVVPQAAHAKTWVEFSHRMMSGLFGILIVLLFVLGQRLFAKSHRVRGALWAALIFTISEALLGAKLVLAGLVTGNDSVLRLAMMSLHHINSLLLSGSVALVVLYSGATPGRVLAAPKTNLSRRERNEKLRYGFLILFVVVAITGGFAALASTLFPSSSLLGGLQEDFAADAHYLLRLRLLHPVLATLVGGGIALYFWLRSQNESASADLKQSALQVSLIFVIGVVFGYLTLFSLSPVWMKLVHLLLAHMMWIFLLRWAVLERLRLRGELV
jgi:cytochrome c oxidase assembly protein subunit 15